jgi:2-keto-4-pentenoate hydratase/2-oxohepta-3-ene-1,7-dioic acid hydratase in catechol pathway
MKILCIGKNYAEHVKEMKSAVPTEPVYFMKPDTALVKDGAPFYLPDFSSDLHHEVEIVLKINRNGKNIEEQFAHKYFDEISIGIDFTARDIQAKCKEKGLPWEKAKAFDNSAPIGKFVPKTKYADLGSLSFRLDINGKTVQQGNTKDMIFNYAKCISYVSKFHTLKQGDLLYTGTPEGVGPVKAGDKLEAFIEGEKLLEFEVK